mgnify:CR=1 FL=1|tara:strand:+ start:5403 stop:5573 length:171 start_codon:yes stop_codon:yes gene_type:complete
MTKENRENVSMDTNARDLNNICEECGEKNESVIHNLILTGFKVCKSCSLSKTIFPI